MDGATCARAIATEIADRNSQHLPGPHRAGDKNQLENIKMTESIKVFLEQRHNVTIDADNELFNDRTPSINNNYAEIGWQAIPEAWLTDLRCRITGCSNIVDEAGDFLCIDCAKTA
jgi:hypothetical protein